MPFKHKFGLVIASFVAGLILVAAIASYVFRFEIAYMQNYDAALRARNRLDFSQAEKNLLEAIDSAEHFSKNDDRRYLATFALAQMYVAIGSYVAAQKYIDIAQQSMTGKSQEQLALLKLTANLRCRQARFDDAKDLYLKLIETAKLNNQTTFEIDGIFGLMRLELMFAQRAQFEDHLRQAENLLSSLSDPTYASIDLQIASALIAEAKGRYKTANQMFAYAELSPDRPGSDADPQKLAVADYSAAFYFIDRNSIRARNIAHRELEKCDKSFESYFDAHIIGLLDTLSCVYLSENDHVHARQYIDRQVKEAGKRLSPQHPDYARALRHRALQESRDGKSVESDKDFKECFEIFEKIFGQKNKFIADTLTDLARAQFELKKYDDANANCKRAIAIYKSVGPVDHPSVLIAELLLAQIYRQQEKTEKAQHLEYESGEAFGAADGK